MLATSLIAILSAAFLLPGLVAVYFFYRAGKTDHADPILPSMGSPEGLTQFGCAAIAVHALYVTALWIVSRIDPLVPLPLADPYHVLRIGSQGLASHTDAFALFSGLLLLNLVAAAVGMIAGKRVLARGHLTVFYGPMTSLLEKAHGANGFITAYILTKTEAEGYALGYQGIVTSLVRDARRIPEVIVLKDVTPFRIKLSSRLAEREPAGRSLPNLILRAEDWQNVVFQVFRIESE